MIQRQTEHKHQHKNFKIIMAEIIQIPENGGSSGMGNIPFSIPIGGFGNGMFGGNGMNDIGGLITLAIIASIFGWNGNGGFGGGFGGGNGAAGFLSNQINNDTGRELIMNAINSNGEASRAAVQNLATMLGQDFNLVNSGVQSIRDAIGVLATQNAVSTPEIINAIQRGDADIASQLCKCCCDMKQLVTSQGYENQLATLNQTNALTGAITGASQRNVDAIADLKATMIQSFCDVKEREMQDKINTQAEIITQLRNQADNAAQTAQFAAMLSPINAKLVEIEGRQPNTVPVQWPNLTAVNTTPYVNGGFYNSPFGFGNGITF